MQLFKFLDTLLCQFNQRPDGMLFSGDGRKIFEAVIIPNAVKMMYQITLRQFTLVGLFPNKAMFKLVLANTVNSTNINLDVPLGLNPAAPPVPMLSAPSKICSQVFLVTFRATFGAHFAQLFSAFNTIREFRLRSQHLLIVDSQPLTFQAILFLVAVGGEWLITYYTVLHAFIVPHYVKKRNIHTIYEKRPELRPKDSIGYKLYIAQREEE